MGKARPGGPRYAQLADSLRAEIAGGQLRAGDPLPTENALCERFGVSRFTVREALRQLQADGLIRRRRGSGTVVADDGPALRQPLSDVRELLQYAADSTFEIEHHGLVTLTPARARLLCVGPGERWFRISGVRRMAASSEPVAMSDVYVHRDFAPFVGALAPGREALFRQLERLSGVRIARVTQDIQAVAASAREAATLHIRPGRPALRILRCYIDGGGRIVEMSSSVHPGERFTYSMHIDERGGDD